MSWALSEYVEDAIVDYLNASLPADLMEVYTAWTDTEIEYPCVVVNAESTDNVTEQFTGHRRVEITLAVMSEAVPDGALSARSRNRLYRDAVIDALAQTALQDDINALTPEGVTFSLAQIGKITRSVDADKRVFVSEIELTVIASPKEL